MSQCPSFHQEQKNLTITRRFLQGFQAVADDEILLEFNISFGWVVRVCLAGELIRQLMALCESWELIYEVFIYELRALTQSHVVTDTHPWCIYAYTYCTYMLVRTVTFTPSLIQICCYSSAALWAPWGLWRCEGNKALEAPSRLLPNGGADIYPGRLWAVAAAPTEMIQPAVQNIEESILMDEDGYGEGPGDIWGLCAHTVP